MPQNLTPAHSIPSSRILPPAAGEHAGELLRVRLTLLVELEASLHRSRKALLNLDLAGIERGTSEQVGLMRGFAALFRPGMARSATGSQLEKEDERGLAGDGSESLEACRLSQGRILEAVRLQAALLTRAQCKLRVMANMLAGPATIYGPLSSRNFGEQGAWDGNRRRI